MCLCNNLKRVEQLKNYKKETFRFYKVVQLNYCGHIPVLRSYHYGYHWKVGVNKSDSKKKTVAKRDDEHIYRGIHVYTSLKVAKNNSQGFFDGITELVILRVHCEKKDLLGASDDGEAVFKQVTVTKRAYKDAMAMAKT